MDTNIKKKHKIITISLIATKMKDANCTLIKEKQIKDQQEQQKKLYNTKK